MSLYTCKGASSSDPRAPCVASSSASASTRVQASPCERKVCMINGASLANYIGQKLRDDTKITM